MSGKRYFKKVNDAAALDQSGAQADSENETDQSEVDEDSDEAPDAISFSTGKQSALEAKKSLLNFIKEEESKLKVKRKEKEVKRKNEKEEKKKRLAELESKKLPDDILDFISDAKEPVPKKRTKIDISKRQAVKERVPLIATEDFIPLDTYNESTDFKIAVLEARPWQVQKPGIKPNESLTCFRETVLNRKNIRRETVASQKMTLQKQAASGRSALVK